MTCIVALKHEGKIFMGADSAGSDGYTIRSRSDEKVFANDKFLIGYCGSYRIGQILQYSFSPPEQSIKQDDMTFMVDTFIDHVRILMREKGTLKKDNEEESHGGPFIVGYNGELYSIDEDFQVGKYFDDYATAGSGEQTAMGALYAMKDLDITPENKIRVALEAAAEYCVGVREPFLILKQE